MGCLCRTFREEPLARPCVAWANPSLSVFRWVPTPPDVTSLCKRSRAGFFFANPIRLPGGNRGDLSWPPPFWNILLYAGVTSEGRLINPKGGKR